MLVGSSRGWRRPGCVITIIPDACILEWSELVVIAHGRSRGGGRKADEFFHSFRHPQFRNVVDSSLEECQLPNLSILGSWAPHREGSGTQVGSPEVVGWV